MTTLEVKLICRINLQKPFSERVLNGTAIERLIEEALQREAGKQLLDAMQRMRDANVPPLTEDDIATAVTAAHAARKARGEAGH